MGRINDLMGVALDTSLNKIGLNEFIAENYDGS